MPVPDRILEHRDHLPPAERRAAEVVLAEPEAVAFGTVATVAERAGVSGPTVVRLATRLGFDGFADLQEQVRGEIGRRLRPATERIREHRVHDVVGRTLSAEVDNLHATLDAVDRDALDTAVGLLTARGAAVHVVSGEASAGVARQVAHDLALLRPGVEVVEGSPVAVARSLALVAPGDVVLAIDLRRYERWVVDAVAEARRRRARVVALTDNALAPLAAGATVVFPVAAASAGPFDSHVGTLALGNVLVAAVAGRLRRRATTRLDAVEEAWARAGALVD